MSVRRRHAAFCGLLLAICALSAGCASHAVQLRSTPRSPLAERLKLSAWGGPEPTERTKQLLRRYDLQGKQSRSPDAVLTRLTEIHESEPSEELTYALAELSFIRGAKVELLHRQEALEHYWNTVAYSYSYLFDAGYKRQRNPYDPQFRGACDLYNGALEHCLRIAKDQGVFLPGKRLGIETTGGKFEIDIVPRGFGWKPEDFDHFEFVSDYEVAGLTNKHSTYGLGVPLIAVRKLNENDPADPFYPKRLSFPVTAFLRLHPGDHGPRSPNRCELELFDPLEATTVEVAGINVALESDLSTPLAFFLDTPTFAGIDTFGLFRPDKAAKKTGLYMLQPFQPDKIPVLMVHGLWSSPMTWMEMFNDLRSDPQIRDHYQFWFYLYPTGQHFLLSAAELRDDLREMRQVFDPQGRNASLNEMVVVGHSMGGLVGKLQTLNSGDKYWKIVSDKPFRQVSADSENQKKLEETFFFDADPHVTRLVTIATPHNGSHFSNHFTQWVGHKLVHMPRMWLDAPRHLIEQNPDLARSEQFAEKTTSIDALAPDSPVLQVMYNSPLPLGVKHHNIVGHFKSGPFSSSAGDGVVPFSSAHLDNVESEIVVDADHTTVHRHPLSVLEVRRILLLHLQELYYDPQPGEATIQQVHHMDPKPVSTPKRRTAASSVSGR